MTVSVISSGSTVPIAPVKAPETTQQVKPPPPPEPAAPKASVNTSGERIGSTISTTA